MPPLQANVKAKITAAYFADGYTFRTISTPDGQMVANTAFVEAGSNGAINVDAHGGTDMVLDIAGYFTDDRNVSNLVFYPLTLLDQPDLTVVPPAGLPYVTVWPSGRGRPQVSSINSFIGLTLTNTIVPAGANGSINLYAYRQTHVLLEVSGYFAP